MIKKIVIDKATRLYQLPPDIFSFSKEKKRKTIINKSDVIDLGHFEWPVKLSDFNLPDGDGFEKADENKLEELRAALAQWYLKYHKVKLNPYKEIFIGGKISTIVLNLAIALVDEGDVVFVPDLGLPLYKKAVTICGGESVGYSISLKNNWQPVFDRLTTRLGRVARMMFLNNPHNPTGAIVSEASLDNLIRIAAKENIAIINDAAYQSLSERMPSSLLSIPGGIKIGLEINSFSYNFGLPNMPFGYAVGNKDIINGLNQISPLTMTDLPEYFADMVIHAIYHFPNDSLKDTRKKVRDSSAAALSLFKELKLEKESQDSVPYAWGKIEKRKNSNILAEKLLSKNRILTAPGKVFGDNGEGFLRFSLTASPDAYATAAKRVKKGLLNIKKDKSE